MSMIHEHIKFNQAIDANIFSYKAKDISRIIPLHWHQATEIIYCHFGSLMIFVNGKHYQLNQGDIILINANTPHFTQSTSMNHIYVLQINSDFHEDPTKQLCLFPENRNDTEVEIIKQNMIIMGKLDTDKTPYFEKKALSLLFEIEYILLTKYLDNDYQGISIHKSHAIIKIINYLKSNFDQPISLSDVANEFGYTPSYLSRYFLQHSGINFKDYIATLRLEKAIFLMKTSNLSNIEIAFQAGFPNVKSFRDSFKRMMKMNPSDFMKKNKL